MNLSRFYSYDRQHGAVFNDINRTQYGVDHGQVVTPSRHYFFYRLLLDRVCSQLSTDDYVLDAGCGMGILAEKMRGGLRSYVGMDISLERVRQARQNAGRGNCSWVVGDAQRMPFKPQRFSRVVSLEVIEHVLQPPAYLDEVARVLEPGGVFIFSTPGSYFHAENIGRVGKDQHLHQFSPGGLKRLCAGAGMRLMRMRGIGLRLQLLIPCWMGSDLLKRSYALITRKPLRAGYGYPVSIEFDIVTSSWVQKLYALPSWRWLWRILVAVAAAWGRMLPGCASTMVGSCRK
jgi:2-polyprenyl-3-methyl-5-hydroxy-6-metoxy-1,4-benzoquinol methylase